MDVTDVVAGSTDAMTVARVFGEAYQVDGAVVIPAARVQGGAGGGASTEGKGGGYGTGFGLVAHPAGVYVSRDGNVTWKPAVDVNRVILGGQVVAIVALLVARAWIRARSAGRGRR
jgi:uncharacterized spore protein YtfJ